jgi:hypothetical protein
MHPPCHADPEVGSHQAQLITSDTQIKQKAKSITFPPSAFIQLSYFFFRPTTNGLPAEALA